MKKSSYDLRAKSVQKSSYKLAPSATTTKSPQSTFKLAQTSVKSSPQFHNMINHRPNSNSPPPLQKFKSKMSKSKRLFNDQQSSSTVYSDLALLVLYYIALYTFYAAFWYAAWTIYSRTLPENRARFPPPNLIANSTEEYGSNNGIGSRSSIMILCNNSI